MTNYHQHSTYCDGKDSIADVAKHACQKGFSAIGFTSHAPLLIERCPSPIITYDWAMPMNELQNYIHEVRQVQKEYRGRMTIFLGLETDYFDESRNPSHWDFCQLDYRIGSVHFMPSRSFYCPFLQIDSAGNCAKILIEEYNGNSETFYRAYFAQSMLMIRQNKIDILGHMDLINKANQDHELFDRKSKNYLDAAEELMVCAKDHDVIIEINTGYMARKGYKEPFPDYNLIERGIKIGVKFCLTSDCHNVLKIDFAFNEVKAKLKMLGLKTFYNMEEPGKWNPMEF